MGGWVKKKDFTSKNGAWPAKHGDFFKEDIGILLATHESPIFVGVITKISPDIQHFSWLDRWTSSILIWSNQDFTKKLWDSAKRTPTGDLTGNKRYSVKSPVKRYSVIFFFVSRIPIFFFSLRNILLTKKNPWYFFADFDRQHVDFSRNIVVLRYSTMRSSAAWWQLGSFWWLKVVESWSFWDTLW